MLGAQYAFGFKYLKDWLNGIDAVVVVVSFAFLWLHPIIVGEKGLGDAAGVSGITRLVRLVRDARLPEKPTTRLPVGGHGTSHARVPAGAPLPAADRDEQNPALPRFGEHDA